MVALAADTVLVEPNRPQIVRREMVLRCWPARLEGFTIALLSDFHYDAYFSVHPIRSAIGMVNGLRPDLIVLTGDFVSSPLVGDPKVGAAVAEPCVQLLRQLQAPHGLWAVLGNHDAYTDAHRVTSALRSAGIPVLDNRSIPIEHDGARFWLAGVADVLEQRADLAGALHQIPRDEATILLAHEPDYADFVARYPVDLQLSGHSHGGQVRLPFIRPLCLPVLARKYILGQYQIKGLALYVNAGLGTVNAAVRMNCPPEITLLTMRRAQS